MEIVLAVFAVLLVGGLLGLAGVTTASFTGLLLTSDEVGRAARERRQAAWSHLASHRGMQADGERTLVGTDGTRTVCVRQVGHDDGHRTVVEVTGAPTDLELKQNGSYRDAPAIGDPRFDPRFHYLGPWSALGSLDAETREALLTLDGVVEIANGRLTRRIDARFEDGALLASVVEDTLAVARRLDDGRTPLARLAVGARRDPVRGVRIRMLAAALTSFGREADDVARGALTDADPEARCLAATHLGHTSTLLALVRALRPAEMRARALAALAASGDEAALKLAIDVAIAADDEPLLRHAAIDALATHRPTYAVDAASRLAAALAPHTWGRGNRAVRCGRASQRLCRALGDLGSPDAEPALLLMLPAPDTDVSRAAADALKAVGTVGAVASLRAVSERTDSRPLAQACRAAIWHIQSRAGGEKGAVAIVDVAEVGALAEAHTAAGGLSDIEGEPGS